NGANMRGENKVDAAQRRWITPPQVILDYDSSRYIKRCNRIELQVQVGVDAASRHHDDGCRRPRVAEHDIHDALDGRKLAHIADEQALTHDVVQRQPALL